MLMYYLLILGVALFLVVSVHRKKNPVSDQRQELLHAAIGTQLRREFSDYSDELTDDAVRIIAVIFANSSHKIFDLQQRVQLEKAEIFKNNKRIDDLQNKIKQEYIDMREKILIASPPRLKQHLETLSATAFFQRFHDMGEQALKLVS